MLPMDKLRLVIGPAPSELPLDELIRKLEKERARINKLLERKPKVRKTKAKKAKAAPKRKKKTLNQKDLANVAELLGLPMEELLK